MEYTLFQDFAHKIPCPDSVDRLPRPRPVRPYTRIWLRAHINISLTGVAFNHILSLSTIYQTLKNMPKHIISQFNSILT